MNLMYAVLLMMTIKDRATFLRSLLVLLYASAA